MGVTRTYTRDRCPYCGSDDIAARDHGPVPVRVECVECEAMANHDGTCWRWSDGNTRATANAASGSVPHKVESGD